VIFRFDDFELDTALRQLRRGPEVRALQPRAFAVLEYLVRHRDRVVPKEELLEKLWPDVVVTDASVQRAISVARTAIDDDGGTRIRTVQKHGYRFVAPVAAGAAAPPAPAARFRPRFVQSGDVHIAYHTLGEGALDLVIVTGWVFPMRAFFDHPELEAWMRELAALGRVILFDKRGTGLSDRVKALPTLEQRVDDLRAVLDAVGSKSAILAGVSEGGPLSLVYAATFPERVRGLLLAGAFARWAAAPDYPQGWTPQVVEGLRAYIANAWGKGETIRAIVGSRAQDPAVVAWAARAEQEGASPGAARDLLEMNLRIDVRPLLPAVSVPTVVVHNARDRVIAAENGRYLATHIPGARLVESDGDDHVFFFQGHAAFRKALELLMSQAAQDRGSFLTTVLAVEAGEGDVDRAALDAAAARFRGAPDGETLAWSFDGPQRAIGCAHAMLALLAAQGRPARAGVHCGEVARARGRLAGEGAEVARAIARAAAVDEVWVSRVVRDLVHGAPLAFAERDEVALAGNWSAAVLASVPPPEISER